MDFIFFFNNYEHLIFEEDFSNIDLEKKKDNTKTKFSKKEVETKKYTFLKTVIFFLF
jgi:hypothetical protein